MNEIKITAPIVKALTEVEAGNVTFSYRSAPKIKGTTLVQAKSHEWLNKKIADGITSAMLAKLFDAELVKGNRSTYGIYGVSLTAKGLEALTASRTPVPADGPVDEVLAALPAAELTDARLALAEQLNNAAIAARTSVSAKALADAGALVLMGHDEEARKTLVPLRTRAALAAIAAIKAL